MDSNQKYELSKLRILEHLSGSKQMQHGAIIWEIEAYASPNWGAKAGARAVDLLSKMQEDGLIERRVGPRNGRPYFLTQTGKDYLAEATEKAVHADARADWRAWVVEVQQRDRQGRAERDVSAVLRGLPEFQNSGEQRIQLVSRQLVRALSQTLAPSDGQQR